MAVSACSTVCSALASSHMPCRCLVSGMPARALTAPGITACCMQERPEDVPTGELPRSISLLVDRHLVGRAAPGTRVKAIGIHTTLAVRPRFPCECVICG